MKNKKIFIISFVICVLSFNIVLADEVSFDDNYYKFEENSELDFSKTDNYVAEFKIYLKDINKLYDEIDNYLIESNDLNESELIFDEVIEKFFKNETEETISNILKINSDSKNYYLNLFVNDVNFRKYPKEINDLINEYFNFKQKNGISQNDIDFFENKFNELYNYNPLESYKFDNINSNSKDSLFKDNYEPDFSDDIFNGFKETEKINGNYNEKNENLNRFKYENSSDDELNENRFKDSDYLNNSFNPNKKDDKKEIEKLWNELDYWTSAFPDFFDYEKDGLRADYYLYMTDFDEKLEKGNVTKGELNSVINVVYETLTQTPDKTHEEKNLDTSIKDTVTKNDISEYTNFIKIGRNYVKELQQMNKDYKKWKENNPDASKEQLENYLEDVLNLWYKNPFDKNSKVKFASKNSKTSVPGIFNFILILIISLVILNLKRIKSIIKI
ncbi:MAG: hypothetical protein SOZ89_03385 [Peptoniphilaceae bacterium]|nr:hypothetical protein [Peptoniphilaceae bacterium]MDD7383848.1 hypothetical protein [Peptoniphilaceae bacterium]MDY3738149.1 hypothetical protein [Peptoniphilaceae bacterium]MDY6018120.1 hypothetical protein [Anaerococcus sp.]